MDTFKILITGATGYIGGTVLSTLLEGGIQKKHPISVVVRGEDKAAALQTKVRAASEHDIVIHTASGFHTASAKALNLGLGERKKATGHRIRYIHTSGTPNMADQPITGIYNELTSFMDKSNIYAYEKYRESLRAYPQRTSDIVTVETGLEVGVPTTIIMSPTIYDLYANSIIINSAINSGQAITIGEGKGIWDNVHIADLARLYQLFVEKIVAGEQIPTGENGILFSGTGRHSWKELSQNVANALFTIGTIKTDAVRSVDLEEIAKHYSHFPLPGRYLAELGYASNSRTSSDLGRELGWKPEKTDRDFKNYFSEEAKFILAEGVQQNVTSYS